MARHRKGHHMPHPEDISDAERTALRGAIGRALDAHRSSGRTGIAAAIVRNGEVIETAENHVEQDCDPTRHAEMVALSAVTTRLGRTELSDCTLISTLQPCEMCLAAMRFAGIGRVIFAATQDRVAGKYFVFPGLGIEDFRAAGDTFTHIGGVMEEDVLHLYADAAV